MGRTKGTFGLSSPVSSNIIRAKGGKITKSTSRTKKINLKRTKKSK